MIYHGSEYIIVTQGFEYAGICVNRPKSARTSSRTSLDRKLYRLSSETLNNPSNNFNPRFKPEDSIYQRILVIDSVQRCSVKKVFLEVLLMFTGKHLVLESYL